MSQSTDNNSNIKLRILFWGNQGNVSYRLASYLRQRNIGCDLISLYSRFGKRNDPANVDPNFSHENKPWFKLTDGPFDSDFFRQAERDYDLVFASGHKGIETVKRFDEKAVPIIIHTTGPQNIPSADKEERDKQEKLKGLHKASLILTAHLETYARARLLDLGDKVRFQLPLLDMHDVIHRTNEALHQELEARYSRYDKVFAWFSRNLTDPANPTYKGTEVFIEAAAEFFNENKGANVRIIFGNHGPNAEEALDMIQSHGLIEHVDLLDHLEFPDLAAYLKLPNLVLFDNLVQGTISSGIFRDAMCLGTLLVRRMWETDTSLAYGERAPVINASDVSSCYEAMNKTVAMSQAEMEEHQAYVLKWAKQSIHWEARVDKYIDVLREVIMRHKLLTSKYE